MYKRIAAFALTFALGLLSSWLFQSPVLNRTQQGQKITVGRLTGHLIRPNALPEGCYDKIGVNFNSSEFKPKVFCNHSLSPDELDLLAQYMARVHGPTFLFEVVTPTNPVLKPDVRKIDLRSEFSLRNIP
jgi:hypothetical protein